MDLAHGRCARSLATYEWTHSGKVWRRSGVLAASVLAVLAAGGCPNLNRTRSAPVLQPIVTGLTSPVALVPSPDDTGRLFIVDQIGRIRILRKDGTLASGSFLDLRSDLVDLQEAYDERGLLGLAFHPDFATNRKFYVYYTVPRGDDVPEEFDSENLLCEFRASVTNPDVADKSTGRVLLRVLKPQFNHNGGQLAFGPDGLLYISTGDGGGANDQDFGHNADTGNGQDITSLLGKILRIDVDGGTPYGIPPGNPFADSADGIGEIYAYGFRNPWRYSFDGDRLFVGDVGQDRFEKVDDVKPGGNYGWRIREGTHCFDPDRPDQEVTGCADQGAAGEQLIDPVLEYSHVDANGDPFGIAIIGGFVYRGSELDSLRGKYIFGDFSSGFSAPDGRLLVATPADSGAWSFENLAVDGFPDGKIGRYLLGFGQDLKGELYVLTTQMLGPSGKTGVVYKLVPGK